MKKHLLSKAGLALAALTVSASAVAGTSFVRPQIANKAVVPQVRTFNPNIFAEKSNVKSMNGIMRSATIDADKVLPGSDGINYLLAPDGSVWYSTITYDYDEVELEGGWATEKRIKGFEITVYNNLFQEVGKVKDTYTLTGTETKIASLQPDMALTKKFFNTDDKYELIVSVFCNNPDYTVTSHSLVYSIGGATDENGNTTRVAEIPGYVIDSDNYATNEYSENYFITFMETVYPGDVDNYETYADYLEAYKYKLSTYTKAGWSSGATSILDLEIGNLYLPGDAMTTPFFLMTKTANGMPAFVLSYYDKAYFANQEDFSDYTATADNKLHIDVYTLPSLSSKQPSKTTSTTIDMEAPEEGYLKYYGIGSFNYTNDVDFTNYTTDGSPAYIVTVTDYLLTDIDTAINSYYVYNKEGEPTTTLYEEASDYIIVSDVAGKNKQAIFIDLDGDDYYFYVIDIVTGEEVVNFPSELDEHTILASIDRVNVKGEDFYACSLSDHIETEDGLTYEQIAWVNTKGEIDHIDRINLGEDVMYAQVYIAADGIQPYLFDTDDDYEYLALVKRSQGSDTSATDEYLLVADAAGEPILEVGSDDEDGTLYNVSLFNVDTNPTLHLLFENEDEDGNDRYFQHLYTLPLTKFAGGKGTADDPYKISTIADLQQMKSSTAASYVVVNDIDGEGFDFNAIEGFTGTLDGGNFTISNFTPAVSYSQGMFSDAEPGASVKNLNFNKPVMNLTDETSMAGVVAGQGMGLKLENVNVYNLTAKGDDFSGKFGSLVGSLTNDGSIYGCYVAGANINLPEGSVGGLANTLKTDASVKSSAFFGNIKGGSTVGGAVAAAGSGFSAYTISDCHVSANIVAKNTVGGLIGDAARSTVNRNVVEGTIEATKTGWYSYSLGGLIGYLSADYNGSEAKVVTNNIIAVSKLTAPEKPEEEYAGQHDTVHRVIGHSSANEEPEVIDYDDDWNPIYSSEPNPADAGLDNNFVTGNIDIVNSSIADDKTSTEGKTMDVYECDGEFLAELGYVYGESLDAPWSESAFPNPALYFEKKLVASPAEYSTSVGQSFTMTFNVFSLTELSEEDALSSVSLTWNESLLDMGDMAFADNVLSIKFTCLKEGTSTVSVRMLGSSATATVYGTAGVESVVADSPANAISYDGSTVSCAASQLTVYNLSGVKVATGYETLNVSNLTRGIYVVSAVSANSKSVAKIAVK